MIYSQRQRLLLFGLMVLGLGLLGSPSLAESSSTDLEFRPPNRGAPGQRRDAGSRFGCPEVSVPFTALMPITNYGETLSDRPTLWFIVPPGHYRLEWSSFISIEGNAISQDIDIQEISNGTYQLVELNWPDTAPPLDLGQIYEWQAFLICDPDGLGTSYWQVNGAIQRRMLPETVPNYDSERDRLLWLAREGLWLDTVTGLLTLRSQYPDHEQVDEDWRSLLSHDAVGLEELLDIVLE